MANSLRLPVPISTTWGSFSKVQLQYMAVEEAGNVNDNLRKKMVVAAAAKLREEEGGRAPPMTDCKQRWWRRRVLAPSAD